LRHSLASEILLLILPYNTLRRYVDYCACIRAFACLFSFLQRNRATLSLMTVQRTGRLATITTAFWWWSL